MHLILVESSKKAQKVKSLLFEMNLHDEFNCSFTGGRIFDFKVNDSAEAWERLNPAIHDYLTKQIMISESVIAMTDADEQGEYIAFQIATLADDLGKTTIKGDLIELTEKGLKSSLQNSRPINLDVVKQCHAERLLNLKVAKFGIENGFGPTSIHKLLMAEYLEQTEPVNVANLNIDGQAVGVLTKGRTLSYVEKNLVECPILPPSTFDVYASSLVIGTESLEVIADRLQSIYEDGLLSYTRSDAHDWYPEAYECIELLEESHGYLSNHSAFLANSSTANPHSAIYIIEPKCLHLNLPELNVINQISLGVLGHSNAKSYVGDVGVKFLNNLSISAGGLKPADPQLQILVGLNEIDLYKPSTSSQQCNALASAFFDGHVLDQQAILNHRSFGKKHFPNLADCIEHKTNPMHSIINPELQLQGSNIDNTLANRAFDELTNLSR
ncbi:toprim domain-containing protein [Vibrio splendidus]|uniref:toprim domain-containing protein n=1 Tax=Vibrio splendidus TaxID=29497 RepID=UPI003D0A7B85